MRIIIPLVLLFALPACGQDPPDPAVSAPLAYGMVRDSVSGAVLPRLSGARDPRFLAVNRQLDSISAELRCLEPVVNGYATEHESETRVTYAADSILSVFIRFSGFCGGAHPINGVNLSVTYDLRTGKPVAFRELFADYEGDAAAIVRVLYPAQVEAGDRIAAMDREWEDGDEEFCLQFYATRWLKDAFFNYTLSDSGLVVEPEMAHALTPCIEEAVVPYARLRLFAAPGGVLARMAARPHQAGRSGRATLPGER